MTEELIKTVSGLAGVGALVWCVVFRVICAGGKYRRFVKRAKARGSYTTGRHVDTEVVLDMDARNQNSPTERRRREKLGYPKTTSLPDDYYIVTYRYYVGGKAYEHRTRAGIDQKRYGSNYPELTVYYSPRNPKRSVIEAETGPAPYRRTGCLMSIVVPILVGNLTRILLEWLF